MKTPRCPSCNQPLKFRHGLRLMNPRKYRCPLCRALLEITGFAKVTTRASFPIGLAIAGFAIYQEEVGTWKTVDSIEFFIVCLFVLVVESFFTWPYVSFRKKDNS